MNWEQLLTDQSRQNGRLFFRLAHRLVSNAQAAEDICQQAMLKAWSQRQTLRDPARLRAWLATTVVNESLSWRRRQKLERDTARALESERSGEAAPNHALDVDDSIQPALEQLSELHRMIVILSVMQALPGREVSQLLQVSPATVSRYLFQAMEKLRELLADWHDSTVGT